MLKSLLLIGCLFVSANFAAGNSVEPETRIVGGQTGREGQFPYIVSFRRINNFHFCAGVIVNSRWILSVAHCTAWNFDLPNTVAVVDSYKLLSGGIPYRLSRVVNHPNHNLRSLQNDISLVQTAVAITFNQKVQSISLLPTLIGAGVRVRVAGWGQKSNPGELADIIQFADKTTLTVDDCRDRFEDWRQRRNIFEGNLCAFEAEGVGSCMGDSGGPLTIDGGLVGLVSWGVACARGFPDVYVRVSMYIPWINGIIGQ